MKKKNLLIGVIACIMLSILAIGGTIAWLTDQEQVTNVVTVGNVNIEIIEDWDEKDGRNIVPGVDVTKVATVKNNGANPAYIRAKVILSNEYFNEYVDIDFNIAGPDYKWFKDGDYYYYTKIVPPGEITEALFSKFVLSETYIEPPIGGQPGFNIDVYAEAIQSQGFEPSDTSSVEFKNAILDAFDNYTQQTAP